MKPMTTMAAGFVLATWAGLRAPVAASGLLAGLALLGIAGCVAAMSVARRGGLVWALTGALAALVSLAVHAQTSPARHRVVVRLGEAREDVLLVGTVVSGPRGTPDGDTVVVEASRWDTATIAPLDVALFFPRALGTAPLPGDRIEVFARVERYPPAEFPGVVSRRRIMDGRGVPLHGTAREAATHRGVAGGVRTSLLRWLALRRLAFERRVRAGLADREAGLALALLTGTRGFLDDELRAGFSSAGIGHLLAISGLHFGVLAGVIWMLLGFVVDRLPRLLERWGRSRVCGAGVMVVLGIYLLLVGTPVSAARAWTALAIGVLAVLFLRHFCPWHALSTAAVAILAVRPTAALELGFQLSFGATAGILLFLGALPPVLRPPSQSESRRRRTLRRVATFAGVSCSATLSTWPILLAHTGTIPVIGLVVNLVVLPVVTVVLFPLLVAGAATTAVWEGGGLAIMHAALSVMLAAADPLSELAHQAGSRWTPGVPCAAATLLMAAGVVLFIRSRLRLVPLLAAVAIAAAGAAWAQLDDPEPALRLHFIPVGQGDATLVEFPDGRRLLVDAGGQRVGRDPGRAIVVPYLWRLGIDHLDDVLLTHADVDHVGGAPAVLQEIDVDALHVDAEADAAELVPVFAAARAADVPITAGRTVPEGVAWQAPRGISEKRNDRSVVVRVARGGFAALLPGDLEANGERALVDDGARPVTLLKVGHHGSNTSTTPVFLRTTRPRVAVVSAGRHSRFGHPHPRVIADLRDRAVRVFSTPKNGLVVVEVDGSGAFVVGSRR